MTLPAPGYNMGRIDVHDDGTDLDSPTLIDGLPGVGLVGKIATDHLIEAFEMDHYASIYCDGLPPVGVYHAGSSAVRAPVRLYADPDRDLLALQSDVPVSTEAAGDFASCVVGWLAGNDVSPVFLSGRPAQRDEESVLAENDETPTVYGITTGDGSALADLDVDPPPENGAVQGPTGALLHHAAREDLDGVGLIVESDPNFPDPGAARALLEGGVEPITGVDVGVDVLADQASQIRKQKQQLAQRMQQAGAEESSQAKPLRMYQ